MRTCFEIQRQALNEAITDILLGQAASQPLVEAEDNMTKAEISKLVTKYVKSELDDQLLAKLKKAIKSDDVEKLIVRLVGLTLASYHEILFTRKGTWMAQLKVK